MRHWGQALMEGHTSERRAEGRSGREEGGRTWRREVREGPAAHAGAVATDGATRSWEEAETRPERGPGYGLASYTTLPPTTVITGRMKRISSSGTVR